MEGGENKAWALMEKKVEIMGNDLHYFPFLGLLRHATVSTHLSF